MEPRLRFHRRKLFVGSDLRDPMTQMTLMTQNRGPFPGGGCGGDQTQLLPRVDGANPLVRCD